MTDNSYILPLFVSGTLLLALFAFFLVVFLLVHNTRQRKHRLERESMRSRILEARLEEQEYSMNKISEEIHDNIGQVLGLAQMNMYSIVKLATNEKEENLIRGTNSAIGKVISDLQNISHTLNGDYIKRLGLLNVLRKESDYINLSKNIKCSLTITGQPIAIDPEKEVLIYRIVQELIHNAVKHAMAKMLTIEISYQPDVFSLTVADNGKGFDTEKIFSSQGIGFENMYHRTALLNGKLDVRSAVNAGCTTTLTIDTTPYDEPEPDKDKNSPGR